MEATYHPIRVAKTTAGGLFVNEPYLLYNTKENMAEKDRKSDLLSKSNDELRI